MIEPKYDPSMSFYESPISVFSITEAEDLERVSSTLKHYSAEAQRISETETDKKIRAVFQDNALIQSQLVETIDVIARVLRSGQPSKIWDEHQVVTCTDLKTRHIQAVGLVNPNDKNTFKCYVDHAIIATDILFLATAYWNIPSKQTENYLHKVKGAGTSIVYYASELGKQYGSKGEVSLTTLKSSRPFYEDKLGFKEYSCETKLWGKALLLSPEKADSLPFKFTSIVLEFPNK